MIERLGIKHDVFNDVELDRLVPGERIQGAQWGKCFDGLIIAHEDGFITVYWSREPLRFTMPNVVRRVVTPSLANSLVSIQPMSAPSGNIFYMDYTYSETESDE